MAFVVLRVLAWERELITQRVLSLSAAGNLQCSAPKPGWRKCSGRLVRGQAGSLPAPHLYSCSVPQENGSWHIQPGLQDGSLQFQGDFLRELSNIISAMPGKK